MGHHHEDLWVHTIDQHPNEIARGLVAKDIEYWLMKEQYIDLK